MTCRARAAWQVIFSSLLFRSPGNAAGEHFLNLLA